jgi:hypothetical protein
MAQNNKATETNMEKVRIFGREGNPTKPDVDKLIEHIDPTEGEVIPYTRIAEVLGYGKFRVIFDLETKVNVERENHRWTTVLAAWRKVLLAEYGTDTAADPGVGIRVLLMPERIDYAIKDINRGTRATMKGIERNAIVKRDQLKEEDSTRYDAVSVFSTGALSSIGALTIRLAKALRPAEQKPMSLPARKIG